MFGDHASVYMAEALSRLSIESVKWWPFGVVEWHSVGFARLVTASPGRLCWVRQYRTMFINFIFHEVPYFCSQFSAAFIAMMLSYTPNCSWLNHVISSHKPHNMFISPPYCW